MPSKATLLALATFSAAALLAFIGALWAAGVIENQSRQQVVAALAEGGHDWAVVETDGLLVTLSGTSPTEAERFRALSIASGIVDAARVIDTMQVAASEPIAPPTFLMEILRNGDNISLIGLTPTALPQEQILDHLTALSDGMTVADMLEYADYPVPDGWEDAVEFGLSALELLSAAKVSITPGRVTINALSESREHRAQLETQLSRLAPGGLRVALDITAPRPVITPFMLRFTIDEDGVRFDACSADTEAARERIVEAAIAAGATGRIACTLGLGVPTPRWADAAVRTIASLEELGAGTATMSDTDITLVVPHTVRQSTFDRVAGALDYDLPDAFSLSAVLEEAPADTPAPTDDQAVEFLALLSPEGLVQLRGRLPDERSRDAVASYARARFGRQAVHVAIRIDPELPDGWPLRSLAALEALAELHHGLARVDPDRVELRGETGNPDSSDVISRILSDKLGQGAVFRINVSYDERLDPVAALPSPESCEADIAEILSERQISFAPGSSSIDAEAGQTLDRIADVLRECGEIRMEVSGHTDSQGRAEMNRALSQSRAEAVINALMARQVLVSQLRAVGYGQAHPIADNATPEGREANRRIEFRLITDTEIAIAEIAAGLRPRDPELEALLEITAQEADEDSPRPRPANRPDAPALELEDEYAEDADEGDDTGE